MTAAALKNPGSCRQCGGAGIVVAADGANFDPCAVCQPAGGVYKVKGWKAPAVPACELCGGSGRVWKGDARPNMGYRSGPCVACRGGSASPLPCL